MHSSPAAASQSQADQHHQAYLKDLQRKQTHSRIERRRREKLSAAFDALKSLCPSLLARQQISSFSSSSSSSSCAGTTGTGKGNGVAIQKLVVLESAIEYIKQLQSQLQVSSSTSAPASAFAPLPSAPATYTPSTTSITAGAATPASTTLAQSRAPPSPVPSATSDDHAITTVPLTIDADEDADEETRCTSLPSTAVVVADSLCLLSNSRSFSSGGHKMKISHILN